MSWSFRPAVRENVGLLIGLAGPTGSGKTYSALRLAKGLAGDKRFAVIDTEHKRALIYADEFQFDHCDLSEPFSPIRYAEAITAALEAGYGVVVVDSMSHEWAGAGGLEDWHDRQVQEMVERAQKRGDNRQDWQLREAYTWPAWNAPKSSHKKDLMSRIIAMPPNRHLILCFRAEPKSAMVEVEKNGQKHKEIVAKAGATGRDGWFPICEKNTPYELTASHLMLPEKPGVPLYIKCPEKLRPFFPTDQPVSEESGRKLAEWARGGSAAPAPSSSPAPTSTASGEDARSRAGLIADARRLGAKLKLSADEGRELAKKHLGGTDLQAGTVAQLTALVNELRRRAGEPARGEEPQQTPLSA